MENNAKPREKLDVPLVAPFEQKLANLTRQRPAIGPAPRSSVLDKIASFLPQLAQENERLKQQMEMRPATDFDIEHIEGEKTATYIEMDLACGLLELRDEAALRAAEQAMEGRRGGLGGSEDSSSGSDSDSDSSDEDDSSSDSDTEGGDARDMEGPSSRGREETSSRQGAGGGRGGEGKAQGRGGAAGAAASSLGAEEMDCDGGQGGGEKGRPEMGGEAGASGSGVGAAAVRASGAKGDGRRRKVAAKRNKMIQELS